jgi:glycine/D-amino acid oxidase-like deaminating enzyme/nitrite reductase/ring-hydroxylating ferredoxin subunit
MHGRREVYDASGVESNPSLWMATSQSPDQPVLHGDTTVEALVVGAGITGLTAARLLLEHDVTVAVIDSGPVCAGVTGFTTAKVTALQSTIYSELSKKWGVGVAAAYGEANVEGLEMIRRRVLEEKIDCDFAPAPAFTYATSKVGSRRVEAEVEAAQRAGLPVKLTAESDLPFPIEAAARLDGQARFHPRRYCLALMRGILANGGAVFERTRALDLDPTSGRVATDRGSIRADMVFVASHVPFLDKGLYPARMSTSRSYAIAFRSPQPLEGMHISVDEPVRSLRATGDGYTIVGGEGHPSGDPVDTKECYRALESWAREQLGAVPAEYRWSAQDYRSADGLPFVGPLGSSGRVFLATGYAKWGMTNGTISAAIMTDLALGRANPWAEVFDSGRVALRQAAPALMENTGRTLANLVARKLPHPSLPDVADLSPGEGGVVSVGRHRAAAFRDEDGVVHAVSAACTHLGCQVQFNPAERTWDCPCHGSRFGLDGKVLHGPAVDDLTVIEVRRSETPRPIG